MFHRTLWILVLSHGAFGQKKLRCLERRRLHLDGSCYFPLTQGPCNGGELVVATDIEGEGVCRKACPEDQLLFSDATMETQCVSYDAVECRGRGERAYATLDGTFECDCAEGWGRVMGQGECRQEGAKCGENRILLPLEQPSWCGDQCVHFESCPHFVQELDQMVDEFDSSASKYEEHLDEMKERICDREERRVCCLSSQSPPPRLARGLNILGCRDNPCSNENNESIPWPRRNGCFQLPNFALTNPDDCSLFLNDDEELECDDGLSGQRGANSSAGKSKCKKTQVWSKNKNKCISKF